MQNETSLITEVKKEPKTQTLPEDKNLIQKIEQSKQGQKFSKLMSGDLSGNKGNASHADFALSGILAFWTKKNAIQMDRIFRQSGLMRSKWDEKHNSDGRTYGQITIQKSIDNCKSIYNPKQNQQSSKEQQSTLQKFNGFEIPEGWRIKKNKLFKIKYIKTKEGGEIEQLCEVCHTVPIIQAIYQDRESEVLSLEVSFKNENQKSITITEERKYWMISTLISSLSNKGLFVHSNNTKLLTTWFYEFEYQNMDKLPIIRSSSRFGWTDHGFLLGEQRLGSAPVFVPADAGEQQTARSLHTKGSIDAWFKDVLPIAEEHPLILLTIVAAHTAPLLKAFHTTGFIFEFASSQSSIGKSTAQRLAESCWGEPGNPGLEKKFLGTEISFERYFTQMNDLPTFLDDTQAFRKGVDPVNIVYMAANGQNMGRASLKGQCLGSSWHTVCFTSGERPLETNATFEGLSARILSINSSPFGPERVPKVVAKLEKAIRNHYGHTGPALIQFLQNTPHWKEKADTYFSKWIEWSNDTFSESPVMGRKKRHAAAILATADILQEAFVLPFNVAEKIQPVLSELAEQQEKRDAAQEAYDDLMAWVAGNQSSFYRETHLKKGDEQSCERYGILYSDGRVAVFPPKLKLLMKQLGHHLGGVKKEWLRRNWIQASKGSYQSSVRILNKKTRVFIFLPNE